VRKKVSGFSGFSDNPSAGTKLPDELFSHLLNEISDLDELKITIYSLWFFSKKEKTGPWISWQNILSDREFLQGLSPDDAEAVLLAQSGLTKALKRGTLLTNAPGSANFEDRYFVPNSPFGRACLKSLTKTKVSASSNGKSTVILERDRPNIYTLYEQHIGPLTPLISDILREAEGEYSSEWLEEAVGIAVKSNVRRWTYVEAILKRWKQEGRNEKERRDHPQDRGKYISGKYGDIIEH